MLNFQNAIKLSSPEFITIDNFELNVIILTNKYDDSGNTRTLELNFHRNEI